MAVLLSILIANLFSMKITLFLVTVLCCYSCSSKQEKQTQNTSTTHKKEQRENKQAKEQLQGVWYTEEANTPLLFVSGDTLRFIDQADSPMEFKVYKDSLYTYGYDTTSYKIDYQSEYNLWFHSFSDRIIKLYKSENVEDSLYFSSKQLNLPTSIYSEVVKKDSVVYYDSRRFRGYVYINPSTYKVNKPSYTDEGIRIDNIFYDNIIHICVYEGTTNLFAKDVYKKDFKSLLTDAFYEQAILANIDFEGVNSEGYHFTAYLQVPDSFMYNVVALDISFEGEMNMKLLNDY